MAGTDGYRVDPDEVDAVVRTMFGQIDEFGALCRQFGQLVPPVRAFGLVGSPAGLAAATTHELIQRAQQALEAVLGRATENVRTAMSNYRATDGGGATGLSRAGAGLAASAGLVQRLQSTGLGVRGIHAYLQNHDNQVGSGVAEVYVGDDIAEVRVQPGDVVTSANVTATVGADGRLYAYGRPVSLPAGQDARVYRSMTTGQTSERGV